MGIKRIGFYSTTYGFTIVIPHVFFMKGKVIFSASMDFLATIWVGLISWIIIKLLELGFEKCLRDGECKES